IDREPLVAAHLYAGIGREALDALVLVGCDDDLPASAHDRAVTLLDEGVAALVRGPLPLRAQLLDARGALRTRGACALRTGHRTRHGALPAAELLRLTNLTRHASRATLLRKALLSRQTLLARAGSWSRWALSRLSGAALRSGSALLTLLDLRRSTGTLLAELLLLARQSLLALSRLALSRLSGSALRSGSALLTLLELLRATRARSTELLLLSRLTLLTLTTLLTLLAGAT